MKHPETSQLAQEAYAASGCKTHSAFVAMTGGAIALRTFRAWLAGEQPAAPIAALVLHNIKAGWKPKVLA